MSAERQVDLNVAGLEEAVLQTHDQKAGSSLTFTLSALSAASDGKQKAEAVLFTKTVSAEDLTRQYSANEHRQKPEAEGGSESVTLPLSPDVTTLTARVMGEGANVASETITLDSNTTSDKVEIFVDVDRLPDYLADQTPGGPSLNVAMYTPIEEYQVTSTFEIGERQKSHENVVKRPVVGLWEIDQESGVIVPLSRLAVGSGGVGAVHTNNDGGVDFIVQKGQSEGVALSAYIHGKGNSTKPITLPEGATPQTMATHVDTGMIYLLDSSGNRLLVKQRTEEGNVRDIQEVSTGMQPIALYLMKKSGKIMVANAGEETVSVFTIGADGAVTLFETVKVSGTPVAIVATPDERFVYISLQNQGISRFRFDEGGRLVWVETVAMKGDVTTLAIDPLGESLSGFVVPQDETGAPATKSLQKGCCRKFFRKLQKEVCHHVLGKGICGENYYYHIYNIPSPPSDPHWPRQNPLPNKINIGVTVNLPYEPVRNVWDTYIDETLSHWNKSSVMSLKRSSTVPQGSRLARCMEERGEFEGEIQVCVGDYTNTTIKMVCGHGTDWSGCGGYKTLKKNYPSRFTSKHILSGFSAIDTFQVNVGDSAYARHVICQEIGHALGLSRGSSSHRDEDTRNRNLGTCMDYTDWPAGDPYGGPSNERPDAEDHRQLEELHGHTDVGVTRGKFGNTMGRTLFSFLKYTGQSGAVQFPRPRIIHVSSNGKSRVYRQDFGLGREITYFSMSR